jgi:hypothetical protein
LGRGRMAASEDGRGGAGLWRRSGWVGQDGGEGGGVWAGPNSGEGGGFWAGPTGGEEGGVGVRPAGGEGGMAGLGPRGASRGEDVQCVVAGSGVCGAGIRSR